MATIEFWGGLNVIGSSKVLISSGDHWVLLDVGQDIPKQADLLREPVAPRPDRELQDRLAVGGAPKMPGLFDPQFLPDGDPLGEKVGIGAIFVTHPHIDHVGLAGFVRKDTPVYAHTDAADVLNALAASGQGLDGGDPEWRRMTDGQRITVGHIEVECVPVDHDVPGATGYIVRVDGKSIAYTGDFRFHGYNPELSREFARRAHGVDVLITEGTTLSWATSPGKQRNEYDVVADFRAALKESDGVMLMSIYPRDLPRVHDFVAVAEELGRSIVWPRETAAFLRELGVAALGFEEPGATAAEIRENPHKFVVQPDALRLREFLDLPLAPGGIFFHANGEPLGEFDSRWSPFVDWINFLELDLRRAGCSGHASADDLHEFVADVAPKVVYPVHTFDPTRLHAPRGTERVIAEYGVTYAV